MLCMKLRCKDLRCGDLGRGAVRLQGPPWRKQILGGSPEDAPDTPFRGIGTDFVAVLYESRALSYCSDVTEHSATTLWSKQVLDRGCLCKCNGTLRNGLEIEYTAWDKMAQHSEQLEVCRTQAELSAYARPGNGFGGVQQGMIIDNRLMRWRNASRNLRQPFSQRQSEICDHLGPRAGPYSWSLLRFSFCGPVRDAFHINDQYFANLQVSLSFFVTCGTNLQPIVFDSEFDHLLLFLAGDHEREVSSHLLCGTSFGARWSAWHRCKTSVQGHDPWPRPRHRIIVFKQTLKRVVLLQG